MNGESHWAKEWVNALLRCSEHFNPAMALHHPAEYYGDAGAAAGPIMTAMAAIGLRRAYLKGPVLIYASSDHLLSAFLNNGTYVHLGLMIVFFIAWILDMKM
jgi:hypothetical protein